jgi:hypothetical protein
MQGRGLDLFSLQLGAGVVEIEQDATLMEFSDEKLGSFIRRGF